jgi:hypothetical protein
VILFGIDGEFLSIIKDNLRVRLRIIPAHDSCFVGIFRPANV